MEANMLVGLQWTFFRLDCMSHLLRREEVVFLLFPYSEHKTIATG